MSASAGLLVPDWVPVPSATVLDLMWLCHDAWHESGSAPAGGMAAAAGWIGGARAGPITGRSDVPVTRDLAAAERIAAQIAIDKLAGIPRLPAESECAALGVVFVAPQPVNSGWARGVETTLRWLLGHQSVDGVALAPLFLPRRRDDGSLASVDELYECAVAAAALPPMAHERREMYRQAEREVERSRRLDERIRALQAAATRSS